MPIIRCPGCEASLEVPPVVPGGVVACPYCGVEFPVKSGGARPVRGGARGGRARGRGRAREEDYYEDDRPARGGYRKRRDPLPIIISLVVLAALGGMAIYMFAKKKADDQAIDDARLAEIRRAPRAYTEFNPLPDENLGEPLTLVEDFLKGDLVTVTKLVGNFNLALQEYGVSEAKSIYSLVYDAKCEEHAERVLDVTDGKSKHEGTYLVKSYIVNGVTQPAGLVSARFELDRRGMLVPGTFAQTGGPTLNPAPEFLAGRGFDILPLNPVRVRQTWGTDRLQNPFASLIMLDGRPLSSLPMNPVRRGGWKITGTAIERATDGSFGHKAGVTLRLKAVENGVCNATYGGQPAEVSSTVKWEGEAEMMLKKPLIRQVKNLKVGIWVRAKTATGFHDWRGAYVVDLQVYKDP